ncbi:MAG: methionine sulfoxide reductase heme-binding subunit [Nocardioidaceae bacterium]|jgi:predicted ferric reductase|nr:methionine sulfoxide reductase heme-binding subunit [Nocardioidaceae bacterium]
MNATDALWFLARGTGTVALVMLTLTVVLGVAVRSGRRTDDLDRFVIADLHKTASLVGTGLVATHLATLWFDPFAQLRFLDLLVPFAGTYRPLWLGLGTLAVDVLVLLVASSLLRHRIGPRAFRAVHWAAYAMWPLALLHGLGTGTDAGTWWFRSVAVACALAVAAAVAWRLSPAYPERGIDRIPRTVPGRSTKAVPR